PARRGGAPPGERWTRIARARDPRSVDRVARRARKARLDRARLLRRQRSRLAHAGPDSLAAASGARRPELALLVRSSLLRRLPRKRAPRAPGSGRPLHPRGRDSPYRTRPTWGFARRPGRRRPRSRDLAPGAARSVRAPVDLAAQRPGGGPRRRPPGALACVRP